MTRDETIKRLEALLSLLKRRDYAAIHFAEADAFAALESALDVLRESEAEREKAAREAAGVCEKILLDFPIGNFGAVACKDAILKHFNLEAK